MYVQSEFLKSSVFLFVCNLISPPIVVNDFDDSFAGL